VGGTDIRVGVSDSKRRKSETQTGMSVPPDQIHQRIAAAAKEFNERREAWLKLPEWIEPLAAQIDADDGFADVPKEARVLIRQSAIMAADGCNIDSSQGCEETCRPMSPNARHTARPAVILLSGGLDSATALAIAVRDAFMPHAMSFRYGQRHLHEIECAKRIAAACGLAEHVIVDIDLRVFGASALTSNIAVPKDRDVRDMQEGIPITYVPARNTIFLSFALAWAETLGAADIFIGVNALDYSGYPDCRPEYIAAYERMANLATRAGIEDKTKLTIHTPLISMTKAQIIKAGLELGVDYSLTSTCYDPSPSGEACGRCDACRLRLRGFAENCVADPVRYILR